MTYNDLLGGHLYRYRTFKKYLDGESHADSNIYFPEDIYVLDKKTGHNKIFIEWELSAYLDFQGTYIPKRQIIRDTCTHVYRTWSVDEFDYTNATCPYTGSDYFKRDGSVTDADLDECGKKLSDCILRFGETGDLPTRAFPMVSRVRIR
jgi:lambda family phage minor tail protein L